MGIFDKAEPFYLEAKVIREKVLGECILTMRGSEQSGCFILSTGNYEKRTVFLESKTSEKYMDKTSCYQTVWET